MGLRLFFLPNFPGATFIQGATFIPDSRVAELNIFPSLKYLIWNSEKLVSFKTLISQATAGRNIRFKLERKTQVFLSKLKQG